MIDLSRYVFEALRKDEEFILYRGQSKDDASQVLVLSPAVERPRPESLKRLEHEYSLKEELDPDVGCPTDRNCSPLGPYRYLCWRIPAVCLSINCSVSHWT